MNEVTKGAEHYVQMYEKYIQKLNVPNDRKLATPLNARWFIRTGYILNRNNPSANEVLEAARKIA